MQSLPFRGFGCRLRAISLYTIQCDSKYNSGLWWPRSLGRLTPLRPRLTIVAAMTYSLDALLIDNVKRIYKAELAIKNGQARDIGNIGHISNTPG
jgi:hypothetical protein